MHLYILATAAEDRLKRWCGDIQAQHYDWKDNLGMQRKIRLVIRPIQLYEIVFPETALKDVLATIQPYDLQDRFTPLKFALRKILNADKIPHLVTPNNKVDNTYVRKVGIGIKKDRYHPDGWEMI